MVTITNIFGLQAAIICADAGLRVIICSSEKDVGYNLFYNNILQTNFDTLLTRAKNHRNITFKMLTNMSIFYDKENKKARIIGFKHDYMCSTLPQDNPNAQSTEYHDAELLVIEARKIFHTPNLEEIGFLFQGHHLPAVMGCREFIEMHIKFGLIPQHNIVIYVSNDMAYDILAASNITPDKVNAIIDTRSVLTPTMMQAEKFGFKIYAGYIITHATGKDSIESVTFKSIKNNKEGFVKSVECDLLLHSSGYEIDVSLFNKMPEIFNISISDTNNITLEPDLKEFFNHQISIIGYNQQSVYAECYAFLKSCNSQIQEIHADDDLLSSKATQQIIWEQPKFYDLHELCRKEAVLFPQDIQHSDFLQILYRYDNPLTIIKALKQSYNFYANHRAIKILLLQMQKIYNLKTDEIKNFYQEILLHLAFEFGLPSSDVIMDKISVSGKPKYHIMPLPDIQKFHQDNELKTLEHQMNTSEIQNYYQKIKEYAGIRAFNKHHIFDISGEYSIEFLKILIEDKDSKYNIQTIQVGSHLHIHDKNDKNTILVIHYAQNKFSLIIPQGARLNKIMFDLYDTHQDKHIALHDVSQSWAYLQLVGGHALSLFEKIIKLPIASISKNNVDIWIENIQLRFIIYTRFDMPHIDIFIVSDAAKSFYEKLINQPFSILPFSQPIYDIMALEAGHIFDVALPSVHLVEKKSVYTTQALAMPLAKIDVSLSESHIYSENDKDNPQGIVLSQMIFSPYYNQYVVPILLKGDFQEWENKIVFMITKDKKYSLQVKIVSDKMLKIQEVA